MSRFGSKKSTSLKKGDYKNIFHVKNKVATLLEMMAMSYTYQFFRFIGFKCKHKRIWRTLDQMGQQNVLLPLKNTHITYYLIFCNNQYNPKTMTWLKFLTFTETPNDYKLWFLDSTCKITKIQTHYLKLQK